MSETRVAARYARSIFDLAVEQNILEQVENDAKTFLAYCHASRKFDLMLKSPIIHKQTKAAVLKKLFGDKFQKTTLAFMKIVLRKNRELVLKVIFEQFIELYQETKGIVTATVYTAMPVSDAVIKEIDAFLTKQTNKNVELSTSVSPALVGGFVLRYEDKLIDASVSTQLKNLRHQLTNSN
jgi:F-type H+-transporting ATPase subunit delta